MAELNKELILQNIEEAKDELDLLYKNLKTEESMDEQSLQNSVLHILRHVTLAWNIREVSMDEYYNMSDETFRRFLRLPADIIE